MKGCDGRTQINPSIDARSKAQPISLLNACHGLPTPKRHNFQGAGGLGKAPHLLAAAKSRQLLNPIIPNFSHVANPAYPVNASSAASRVARSGKTSATRRFSTLNDFRSTSVKVMRPRKSSSICTLCPADCARTTIPEKPMKTPSAIVTSAPGIRPCPTTIGSSDSKHCFNSSMASSGTAGILCPNCTKLLIPVTCRISSMRFSSMQ